MKIIVSLGGSVLFTEEPNQLRLDLEYIKAVGNLFVKTATVLGHHIYIVTGGGKLARSYITSARELGAESESELDWLGINATRLNAQLILTAIRKAASGSNKMLKVYPVVATSYAEILQASAMNYSIAVMGGTEPGHTTDTVAVILAELLNASLIVNATVVAGIYTADPNKEPNAKLLRRVRASELLALVSRQLQQAGANIIIDVVAANLIRRVKIPVYVVNARNLANFEAAISGRKFDGTVIEPE